MPTLIPQNTAPTAPWQSLLARHRGNWGMAAWWLLALFSATQLVGYHHADEVGQISAAVMQKLGVQPAQHMPWEYTSQIRSWLQPGLYYLVAFPWVSLFGFDNLHVERLMLLTQAALLLGAGTLSQRMLRPQDPAAAGFPLVRWARMSMGVLWFLPSMLVRHSSEALSTILLTAALGLWHRLETQPPVAGVPRAAFISGFLAGLAFWARFQTGIFVGGFWCALLFCALRDPARSRAALIAFAGGVLLTFPLGVAVDAWGYGAWTFSPWNYLSQNILAGRAQLFGSSPWYLLVADAALNCVNPLLWGLVFLAAFRLRRQPFYLALATGMACFLAPHLLTPHKELRFLIPMLLPATLLVWGLAEELALHAPGSWQRGLAWTTHYLRVVSGLNVVLLVVFTSVGLVSDRGRAGLALWELPAGSHVISTTGYFLELGEPIAAAQKLVHGSALPPDVPLTLNARVHEQTTLPLRFALSFAVPPSVTFHYVQSDMIPQQCARLPAATVLLTNHAVTQPSLVYRAWPAVRQFPPAWMDFLPPAWRARFWNYKLVRCEDYLKMPPA